MAPVAEYDVGRKGAPPPRLPYLSLADTEGIP
jgi:hypothetical protein